MIDNINIIERPDYISYNDIHELLFSAHKENRDNSFHVKTAEMNADALEKQVGKDGRCYVAMEGKKLVGVTAVRIVERNNRFAKGIIADQILVAVSPENRGHGISSKLHKKVVEFAVSNGINQIEIRTAYNNKKMQNACRKWGFHLVNFNSYSGLDHYTVIMMKWINGCPYSKSILFCYYIIKKSLVTLRYRPGREKRFGI